jgi:hypothetical protein
MNATMKVYTGRSYIGKKWHIRKESHPITRSFCGIQINPTTIQIQQINNKDICKACKESLLKFLSKLDQMDILANEALP